MVTGEMIVAVASGKGGTGKTSVAVSLALALAPDLRVQLVDADVEAPNAHILLRPRLGPPESVSIPVPSIDAGRCTHCGKCAEICAYGAITVIADSALIFPELCHGCGGCSLLCPEEAITEEPRSIGAVELGTAGKISFVRGRLNPGEVLSPPIIRAAKQAIQADRELVLIDCPPGTACPAVESVKGADYCLLVTEPTPFGLNDLELAVEMCVKLDVPTGVVINRADVGDDRVERFCADRGLPVLERLPFDRRLATSYARGSAPAADPVWRKRFARLGNQVLLQSAPGAGRLPSSGRRAGMGAPT